MTTEKYDSDNLLVFSLHLNRVIKGASRDISTSSHESLKCSRPTPDVDNLDINPRLFKIAPPLGDCQRCVLQECSATKDYPNRWIFRLRSLRPDVAKWCTDEGTRKHQQIASMQHGTDPSLRRFIRGCGLEK